MKKILCIVLLVATVSAAQAQKSVAFGVKAGANVSMFGGDDNEGFKSKFGFHGGATVNIPAGDMFSIQPEVLFSVEGAKFEDVDDASINLSWINIPILAQYNNESGFYAELGPQLGFLMSAKQKVGDSDDDIKDSFKSINFGVAIGAGFKTKSGFGFGARYSLGLANIIDDDDADIKQSNIGFGVFYVFGADKK